MISSKLLLLFAISNHAQVQEDVLSLDLVIDKEKHHRGETVTFECSWALTGGYADYETDDIILFWKYEIIGGEKDTITRYQNSRDIIYNNVVYLDRINITTTVDEQSSSLSIRDLVLTDDNVKISCEVHWNQRSETAFTNIGVYVDAENVVLKKINELLEGRSYMFNDTVIEAEATEIATCLITGVYPAPTSVVFVVGGGEQSVDIESPSANEDGLYDVSATLQLDPLSEYDGAEVNCYSKALGSSNEIFNHDNSTFDLEISYYTNEISLEITGASRDGAGNYFINEGETYTISCRANGNPEPEISLIGTNGLPLASGAEQTAERRTSLQYIACSANNNDANYTLGDTKKESTGLDVYYLDTPVTNLADYEYNDMVNMTCAAGGNPSPQFVWLKNGKELEKSEKHNIANIQYTDAGRYTCQVSNVAFTKSFEHEVEVNGPCFPTIGEPIDAQSKVSENSATLTMECKTIGRMCSVSWSSTTDPDIIALGEETTETNDGLYLSSLYYGAIDQRPKPVKFTCTASNSYGNKSSTKTVGDKDNESPFCCTSTSSAKLGVGAIVGIVVATPAILIIIGSAVFLCRGKSQQQDDEKSEIEDTADDGEPSEKAPLTTENHSGNSGTAGDEVV